MTWNVAYRLSAVGAAALALLAGGAALAQHPAALPTPHRALVVPALYGQLASDDWVMVRDDQLFFVGQRGVRSLCPDGEYRLKNGTRLPVRAAHIVPPWVKQGFNPQPEPPGRELYAMSARGRRLVTRDGRLFFVGSGGEQTRCRDGVYPLAGGFSVRVARGLIQEPGHLQGFAP